VCEPCAHAAHVQKKLSTAELQLRSRFRSDLSIASMARKKFLHSLAGKAVNYASDPAQEVRNCALACLAQVSVHFAERRLDRIEVG
jgi:hypothetical protein